MLWRGNCLFNLPLSGVSAIDPSPRAGGAGGPRDTGGEPSAFSPNPAASLTPVCTQPPHKTLAPVPICSPRVGGQRWQLHHPSGLKASPTTEARHRGTEIAVAALTEAMGLLSVQKSETKNHKPGTARWEQRDVVNL